MYLLDVYLNTSQSPKMIGSVIACDNVLRSINRGMNFNSISVKVALGKCQTGKHLQRKLYGKMKDSEMKSVMYAVQRFRHLS